MKIKFGAAIVDGSGKLGGHVASKNRSGNYLRTKVTPKNPQSPAQVASRNGLIAGAQGWAGLASTSIRTGWNNLADNMKKTNIFGDGIKLSGFNIFVSMRKLTTMLGATAIDEAPPLTEQVPIKSFSVAQDGTSGAITATIADAIPTGSYMVIEATEPLPLGQFSVKSKFRQIGIYDHTKTTPVTITTDYNKKYPQLLCTGYKAYFRGYYINGACPVVTGKLTAPVVESTYVHP